MTDVLASPTPAARPVLDALSLDELETLRQELLSGKNSLDELTEDETEYYIAICAAARLRGRHAAKPAGAGGSAATKSRAKATKMPPRSLAEILGSFAPKPPVGSTNG